MPIQREKLIGLQTRCEAHYADREVILYALGVGFGDDPLNEAELPFVYEGQLRAVPTLATVLASDLSPVMRTNVNLSRVVHGEEYLVLHRPLPTEGNVIAEERIIDLIDKGKDKGALIVSERKLRLKETGEDLCTLTMVLVTRADGGFGGPRSGGPEPHRLPTRAPDLIADYPTRTDQALLYALSGDRAPLHRDPQFARAVGFERPIMHGLCTYGIACRAILSEICGYDESRLSALNVRFAAPIYPGELLTLELWVDGNIVSYRGSVRSRGVVVLNNGKGVLNSDKNAVRIAQ